MDTCLRRYLRWGWGFGHRLRFALGVAGEAGAVVFGAMGASVRWQDGTGGGLRGRTWADVCGASVLLVRGGLGSSSGRLVRHCTGFQRSRECGSGMEQDERALLASAAACRPVRSPPASGVSRRWCHEAKQP